MSIRLSILDQSPISEGSNAVLALQETATLAQKAEEWGYTRFWVSEHHDTSTLAGSSPEILIAHLASVTKKIRIGSGGVMLPHYAAYKVAENFKLLEALFPGRIDAGMGRAPGGMPRSTYALHDGNYRDVNQFPTQIDDLLMYLHDEVPEDHPYRGLKATPVTTSAPPVWMLGSSASSAFLAAQKGLPYMFAQFINGDGGANYAKSYRENFKPSDYLQQPNQAVAVFVVCAETEEEAQRIASSKELSMLRLTQGMSSTGTPSIETAVNYPYTIDDLQSIEEFRKRLIVGNSQQVKAQIENLAAAYGAEEVMLVTIAYNFEDKLKSFELIAKELL
ncbi:LLM class flavin-dependent oxidoreductase [Viridibacillus sp. YIM B01967]|uniref:LLM class flavin-dependent oxidoreductase n=1 Tax=Viridibacillus soli TaxID=2798301 RepID=A0ABS1H9J5_9BACL|nr:LLM class flavin-dependent oxidoreductase [Viridibacillus soli]MBK3496081.1 LLM class flavin-dependent oxidoreductase [Viridibacillus soli]